MISSYFVRALLCGGGSPVPSVKFDRQLATMYASERADPSNSFITSLRNFSGESSSSFQNITFLEQWWAARYTFHSRYWSRLFSFVLSKISLIVGYSRSPNSNALAVLIPSVKVI